MAKQAKRVIVGVDVSKASLEIYRNDRQSYESIKNNFEAIEAFLDTCPAEAWIAIEATNTYHEAFVAVATARGLTVYLIDGLRLNHYRQGVSVRAKTDTRDAWLLARYLEREHGELYPVEPKTVEETAIWRLLNRRASVVTMRTQLKLATSDLACAERERNAALKQLEQLIARLEREAMQLARKIGWADDLERLKALPGVAELSALALVAAYRRAPFRNVDAFIAYLGLDVRVRDSGKHKGKRRLTKKGPAELRRLLFLSGRTARMHAQHFTDYFERQIARGKSTTAADMAVGRKIARLTFALLRDQTQFNPESIRRPCMAT